MNTVKEFVDVIDKKLEEMGDNRNNMLTKLGLARALLRATELRDTFPNVVNIVDISNYIGVSVGTLLGTDKNAPDYIPDDIKTMVTMLLKIPEKDRKMLHDIIQLYYQQSNV
jgi:hypothetical protein